jgi:molecular chaperone GrpE (heat shock protein)
MTEPTIRPIQDPDFTAAMSRLIEEAEAKPEASNEPLHSGPTQDVLNFVTELVAPLDNQIRLANKQAENTTQAVARVESTMTGLAGKLATVDAIRQILERQQGVETANQKLFDALHQELKGYKDSFLLDSLLKPIFKDLISLHDDLQSLVDQLQGIIRRQPEEVVSELGNFGVNLENVVCYLVEILNRREVERLDCSSGLVDKLKHKVVQLEPTDVMDQEGEIVRTVKPGFEWRGKSLRSEEVVVRKYSTT